MRVSGFRVAICLMLAAVLLTLGCYFPHQTTFERSVHRQVRLAMPVTAAVANLGKLKLRCYQNGSQWDCTRLPASLLPFSCIERVVMTSSDPDGLVTNIDVRKILCTGM